MAQYIELNQKKITRLKREAQQFQDDIVCAVGTDFMQKIAEAENRMIFDILNGLESEPTADVVPKSEVEKLKSDLLVWKQNRFNIFQRLECYEMTRQKIAREIFEEIERLIANECLVFKDENGIRGYVDASVHYAIAELKKKYTEEKK